MGLGFGAGCCSGWVSIVVVIVVMTMVRCMCWAYVSHTATSIFRQKFVDYIVGSLVGGSWPGGAEG